MSAAANVQSLEAIREFRGALQQFGEQATDGLDSIHAQIHRVNDWLQHERPAYWQQQIRRGYDQLAEARTSLEQCRMRTVGGHRPACLEEKQAVARAKARLEQAQEKLKVVRHWQRLVEEEASEFRGRCSQLDSLLQRDLPRMRGLLDRILASLASYVTIRSPETPDARAADEPSGSAAGGEGVSE